MRLAEIRTPDDRTRYVVLDDAGEVVEPVARYLKHLDNRGCARNTLRSYGYGLKLFFAFLAERSLAVDRVNVDDLAAFVQWLRLPYGSTKVLPSHPVAPARSNRTVNHVLTAVSGFYDYLWRMGEITEDFGDKTTVYRSPRTRGYKGFLHSIAKDRPVAKRLFAQPEPRARPTTLKREEVEALVDACANPRDRLLLVLLYESGLRIGEALGLWLQDVDPARYELRVVDRGELPNRAEIKTPAAERTVPVSADLVHELMDYVAVAHTEEVTTNHVFVKQSGPHAGQPLAYADVHGLFRRLRHKTGIAASAHLLRHTSLTNLAKAGWAPELLRERADHRHFQTTYQLYVHPTAQELRDAWAQTQGQVRLERTGRS
jgi:integrase/recombinase XerD